MSATRDVSGEKETQIAPPKKNPNDYDLLIIGTPVWAFNLTSAIRTYVKNNDLSRKKVALFFYPCIRLGQTVVKTKTLISIHRFQPNLPRWLPHKKNEEIKRKVVV